MILVNKENIKAIMEAANIEPTKARGQNYLVDVEKAEKIVNLVKNSVNSKVLEIGPGLGSLTYHLQNKCDNLTLVDIDLYSVNYLKLEVDNHVNVLLEDALKYDLSSYDLIISNIPYNITTKLIEHMLLSAVKCRQFVLMCQKENFYHFYNVEGSEYGPLSVLIHLLGIIKKEFDVGASSFIPKPNCTSTVFTIEIDQNRDRNDAINTYKLAYKLFLNRRKTILNNLGNLLGRDKAQLVLNELNINPLDRPEQLSPETFLRINNKINDAK